MPDTTTFKSPFKSPLERVKEAHAHQLQLQPKSSAYQPIQPNHAIPEINTGNAVDTIAVTGEIDVSKSFSPGTTSHGYDPNEVFADQVSVFIKKSIAEGALIESMSERLEAQSIIDYWVTRLIRLGSHSEILEGDTQLLAFDEKLAPDLPDEPCPYPGLAAFQEQQRPFFFGRDQLVNKLLDKLQQGARFIAVIGASGSGKSSVVRAGLLPKLNEGALRDSDTWRFVTLAPGPNPLAALNPVLAAPELPPPLLVVVDQFEEIFTLTTDEAIRNQFARHLADLVEDPRQPHRVIITLRLDYVEQMPRLPALMSHYRDGRVDVEALDANELRAAIEEPAKKVGLVFAEGIVEDMIDKIRGERAGLPLLQFALRELWNHRDHNRITHAVYKKVGNPLVALNDAANQFYNAQIHQNKDAIRRILLKMVRPTDGSEFTSKRITRAQAFVDNVNSATVKQVLDDMIRIGLIKETRSVSDASSEQDAQIEVSHEALVRNWSVLRSWLDEERDSLRNRQDVTDATGQWLRADRDESLLMGGKLLESAKTFRDLSADEQAYVDTSLAAVAKASKAAERTRLRELMYEREKKISRLLRMTVGALVAVTLAAAGLAGVATSARATADELREDAEAAKVEAQNASDSAKAALKIANEAQERANASKEEVIKLNNQILSRERALKAESLLESNPSLALRIAITTQKQYPSIEAANALRQAFAARRAPIAIFSGNGLAVREAQLSYDGAWLLTSGDDPSVVRVWDVAKRQFHHELKGHKDAVNSARFSRDNRWIVTASADGTARMWTDEGKPYKTFPHKTNVIDARFSPDGQRVMTIDDAGNVRIWNVKTGTGVNFETDLEQALSAQFSPDYKRVAVAGSANTMHLWEVRGTNNKTYKRFEKGLVSDSVILFAEFSPNSQKIVTINSDQTAQVWNVGQPEPLFTLKHNTFVQSAHFAPDNQRVITVDSDGTVHLWEEEQDVMDPSLVSMIGPVNSAEFSQDGKKIVTTDAEGTARVWPVDDDSSKAQTDTSTLTDAQFSQDGKRMLLIDQQSQGIRVLNGENGAFISLLTGHKDIVVSAFFSPNGKRIVSCSTDNTARVWETESGTLLATLPAENVSRAQFSVDSQYLITFSEGEDGQTLLWERTGDGTTYQQRTSLKQNNEVVTSWQFASFTSLNSRQVATGDAQGVIRIWDSATGKVTTLSGHTAQVSSLFFIDDASGTMQMVSASDDGTARVWLLGGEGWQVRHVLGLKGGSDEALKSAQISPTGRFVLTVSTNGKVRLWDLSENPKNGDAQPGNQAHNALKYSQGALTSAQFSVDGKRILTRSEDGELALWGVDEQPRVRLSDLNGKFRTQFEPQFSPDGKRIWAVRDDGTPYVQYTDIAGVITEADKLELAPLTCPERVEYLDEILDCPDANVKQTRGG